MRWKKHRVLILHRITKRIIHETSTFSVYKTSDLDTTRLNYI